MNDTGALGLSGRIARFFLHSQLTPLVGGRRVAARPLRGGGHAARGGAADRRHDGERVRAVPGRVGRRRRAAGRDSRRAGAVADPGPRARLVGVDARPGDDHRPVQGRRPAQRRGRPAARHDPVAPRLAAAGARRRRADGQAQGHRRRPDRRAHAVDAKDPRAGAVGPRARRARGRGGAEARARHARGRRPSAGRDARCASSSIRRSSPPTASTCPPCAACCRPPTWRCRPATSSAAMRRCASRPAASSRRRATSRDLVVAVHDGRPVFLSDVANVVDGPPQPARYAWHGAGQGRRGRGRRVSASRSPRSRCR